MPSDDILNLSPASADERLAYGSDPNQFGDLRLPGGSGPHPLVMNIHGGFWRAAYDLSHAGHLCAALTGRGIATWNIEYRRVGDQGGGWPGTIEDISAAYRYLRQKAKSKKIDAERLVVMGHSAGAQLALCLAAHEPSVPAVVSLAGVLYLQGAFRLHLSNDAVAEFLGGAPAAVPEHYREACPLHLYLPRTKQRLIHGLADDIVPPEFSRLYFQQKKAEDVHLVEIEKADHFDLINPRSFAWAQVEQVVTELLSA